MGPFTRKLVIGVLLALAVFIQYSCNESKPVEQITDSKHPSKSLFKTPISGAIFTTNSTCTGVNLNIYSAKENVYLDGGPAHTGAAGLPDGEYYCQITDPSGSTVLGTSIGTADETPIEVSGGEFIHCYQLSSILMIPGDGPGYADSPNNGNEYKVWVSADNTFDPDLSKTDNFKVRAGDNEPPQATLNVIKFYDANANGLDDDELQLTGWKVRIQDNIDFIRYTPVSIIVDPDNYIVTEFDPVETCWMHTTPTQVNVALVQNGQVETVEFGNVCLGAGGGLTLGFWSNKNGQALIGSDDLSMLNGLFLRNANGTGFDPGTSYKNFRTWLLNATATNMAYMLSAQLAAMELNVLNGKVDANALIYAPGTNSANNIGFATVGAIMAEANSSLSSNGLTLSGDIRAYQETLKNALDNANNNKTFVQLNPCTFSFAL